MDSSLEDLARKGNIQSVPDAYNPGSSYRKVIHFSPYSRDMRHAEFLGKYRIELHSYEVSGPKWKKTLFAFFRVFSVLRKERPDIIRGRLPYFGSLLGIVCGRMLSIPCVVSLGGDNRIAQERQEKYQFGSRRLSYAIEYLVLKLCDAIIVPNRYTLGYVEKIIGADAAQGKCHVIPWYCKGVPTEPAEAEVNPYEFFSLPPDALLVPIIGFVNRYKFSDVLFDVLDGCQPEGVARPVVFLFCGDGELREEGERRFCSRGDVRFLGWQKQAIVHSLIRHAALVVVPMSGYVLLETASVGRPVVSSRVEWHSELVRDGVTGLLVDPEDREQWRDAIARLLADREAAENMGGALRRLFDKEYSPRMAMERELALYVGLIRGGSK